MTIHVTIVDDNRDNLDSYRELLEEEFSLKCIQNPLQLLPFLQENSTHLVLLDLHMPQMNGFEVYHIIKESHPELPVVFLSGDPSEESVVKGLDLGAVDFIVKPITSKELIARIRNRAQFSQMTSKIQSAKFTRLGNLCVYDAGVVHIDDQVINLTPSEFRLLSFFTKNIGRVITKEELLTHSISTTQGIDHHVANLKKKLEKSNVNIKTIRKVGYILPDQK